MSNPASDPYLLSKARHSSTHLSNHGLWVMYVRTGVTCYLCEYLWGLGLCGYSHLIHILCPRRVILPRISQTMGLWVFYVRTGVTCYLCEYWLHCEDWGYAVILFWSISSVQGTPLFHKSFRTQSRNRYLLLAQPLNIFFGTQSSIMAWLLYFSLHPLFLTCCSCLPPSSGDDAKESCACRRDLGQMCPKCADRDDGCVDR
jgi:hypothetical protein